MFIQYNRITGKSVRVSAVFIGLFAPVVISAQTLPSLPVSQVPVATYEYDAQGNITKSTQAPGVTGLSLETKFTYDTLQRRSDVTSPAGAKTKFTYSGSGEPLSVVDSRDHLTEYTRNGFGDIVKLSSPDSGVTTSSYDESGNLTTRANARGVVETFSYDAMGRLSSAIYTQSGQSTQSVSWGYDLVGPDYANGVGHLSRTDHPNGASRFKYDPQGRVTEAVQAVYASAGANSSTVVTTVKYGYTLGRLTSIIYPSGRKLEISYSGGQVVAVALAKNANSVAAPLISDIKWEPFGGASSWNWNMSSGIVSHQRYYDQSGRIIRYRLGSVYRDIGYDEADRAVSYKHYLANDGTPQVALDQSFAYDPEGRITGVVTASAAWSIAYDANGNRTSVSLNGASSIFSTEASSNRLTSVSGPSRVFTYDGAGNITSDGSGYAITYGIRGLASTVTKSGVVSNFEYDAERRRIRKFTSAGSASTRIFVYDLDGQVLGEYDQAGNALKEYVWLGSTPIAVFTANGGDASANPWVYFIHADHLNTPRIIVDQNGGRRWRWLAEPFGTSAPETNPDGLGEFVFNLRFPGQYADVETGLFQNYFRTYDPSLGRYIQSDPVGLAGGWNTYAYAEGQPTAYVDPRGLAAKCSPWVAIGYGEDTFRSKDILEDWGPWKLVGGLHKLVKKVDEGEGALLVCDYARQRFTVHMQYVDKNLIFERTCTECGKSWAERKNQVVLDETGSRVGESVEEDDMSESFSTKLYERSQDRGGRVLGLCRVYHNK
ncbi:RHS repeat protein [Rhizobacter sp. SG703]|uniref:RHS repeat domain-containing protein n=1 Tax=Rhizobacter sp. SG703 TaxID=2587140 RepID=UPI0014454AC0|nr:RHS repeat protein [Rhizobacter sp. SG703]NKI94721.1 RHS repeat-associated protein [Rhizobacter sp. SG703]